LRMKLVILFLFLLFSSPHSPFNSFEDETLLKTAYLRGQVLLSFQFLWGWNSLIIICVTGTPFLAFNSFEDETLSTISCMKLNIWSSFNSFEDETIRWKWWAYYVQ